MIHLIKTISNPLTIIAIFASLAEVFGTVTVQFMEPSIQAVFVWFLVGFPTLLVLLFFATLNWNRVALYAPGDYRDEANYMNALKGVAVASRIEALDRDLAMVKAALEDRQTSATEKVTSVSEKLGELQERVNELQNSTQEMFADAPNIGERIVLSLIANGATSTAEIARTAPISESSIAGILHRLAMRGLIKMERVGREVRVRLVGAPHPLAPAENIFAHPPLAASRADRTAE